MRNATKPLLQWPLLTRERLAAFTRELTHKNRKMLDREAIRTCFPQLFRNGLPAGYYVEGLKPDLKLGLVRVDSRNASIKRILQKTNQMIRKHQQQAGFRQLIKRSQFDITWVVFTDPKQTRLKKVFDAIEHSDIKLRVAALPMLLGVAAPTD